MASKPAACAVCATPLVQPETGRPRLYCSDACRRVGAHEIRRLDRQLDSLESERDAVALAPRFFRPKTTPGRREAQQRAAHIKAIETLIGRKTERLRLLLDPPERTEDAA